MSLALSLRLSNRPSELPISTAKLANHGRDAQASSLNASLTATGTPTGVHLTRPGTSGDFDPKMPRASGPPRGEWSYLMPSTSTILATGTATRRGPGHPTARRALRRRPALQSLVLGIATAWHRALRPGSRPTPRHAWSSEQRHRVVSRCSLSPLG